MPFAVFRQHQKKMLVVIAILAIMGFVLSDSLNRFAGNRGDRYGNRVVVDLFGEPIYKSELDRIAEKRSIANRFVAGFLGDPTLFGGYTTRDLIDAKILEHEADRLGIPDTPEFAQTFLKNKLNLNKVYFEMALRQLGGEVGGNQVLACIASQIRLTMAQQIAGSPYITPLDVYQAYRDQNERSSFRVISFPASNYLDKAGEPPDAEVEALYEKYKDVLPDPNSPTPGFKVPREVKLEILTADVAALAKTIREKLPEPEVRAYYDARKAEFNQPSELPYDLFKDDDKNTLTPPLLIPFADVKDALASALALEKAQDQVTEVFGKIKDDVIDPFSDAYQNAVDENAEAKKNGETRRVQVPESKPLAEVAKANNLAYATTRLLSYDAARSYGEIGGATLGSKPMATGGTKFVDAIFAPKSPLYDGMEFSDRDRRFLLRKLEDVAPRVAPLTEVRAEVVSAWKLDKARGLAEAAAKAAAELAKKDGGKFKENLVSGRPVVAIESVSRLRQGMPIPGRFGYADPSLVDLPQIPGAGESIRNALFNLKPGQVAVEPDGPKTVYYVLTLDRREPATFAGLYSSGVLTSPYQNQAVRDAFGTHGNDRLEALRARAGLKPGWAPADEKDRDESRRDG